MGSMYRMGKYRTRAKLAFVGGCFMTELLERITTNPKQCGGRPCVRGMRIRVVDVLDLLAEGLSRDQVVEELPDLEPDDVRACLAYARRYLDHRVVAA